MTAISMKRMGKRFPAGKKKTICLREVVVLFPLALSKGPVNLALSKINLYLKQLAPCSSG